ncbi:thioredoxin-like protein [Radiomyces spectabilis]|uniref:thioredoxin-like protein n=1 Tax=Radiomyces spectabilis TaxID=64574 RepID=UPI002221045F|nr:thioredoxin-like protein [Radiomyces spectabilis]KAI8393471.1 thioredoxin-like protein [Radiomyces spectabilis]
MFALRRAALSALPRVARTTSAVAAVRPLVRPASLATQSTLMSRSLSTTTERPRATIQHAAPQWTADALVQGEFKKLSLADYKNKFVVMVFYPADFTFVCPTELLAFSDRIDEFRALGAEVVGISVDNVHSHLAWTNLPRNKGGLGDIQIPLISDIKKEIATDYNVLIPDAGLALRGLFVIDPKGTLRVAHIHDLPIGRSVDETLRVIEAIKFTDEHGEVCPANWRKGDKTIKANPKDSQAYFEAVNK